MQEKPPIRPAIKYLISNPHSRADFSDIIASIMSETRPKVQDGKIQMKLICKSQEIQRFGKTFYVTLLASGDNIVVKVNEKILRV